MVPRAVFSRPGGPPFRNPSLPSRQDTQAIDFAADRKHTLGEVFRFTLTTSLAVSALFLSFPIVQLLTNFSRSSSIVKHFSCQISKPYTFS